ncbi:MAG: LamG domain-containing protein, partial [Desulfuromonadales bacterium]|nr:LamG domain-containing protein [Desulfuromonadales bacterium]
TWFHIAAVYDGSTRQKRLYIDGALDGSDTISRIDQSTKDLIIGGSPSLYYSGRIDALRLWNTARSQDEILADIDRDLT